MSIASSGGDVEQDVGHMEGVGDVKVVTKASRGKGQQIILGSEEPTQQDWDDAGVGGRGASIWAVSIDELCQNDDKFIIVYAGFEERPHGTIKLVTPENWEDLAARLKGSLEQWYKIKEDRIKRGVL